MINAILKKLPATCVFVLASISTFAQWIGETNPSPGVNYVYTYDNDLSYSIPVWSVSNGTLVSSSINGTSYTAIVNWTSAGVGSLTFKQKLTVIGVLNVNVNVCTQTPFTVAGGGTYCPGGSGVSITLSGSQVGVNYQKYINGVSNGTPLAGTGSALTWSNQTTSGNYTIVGTNTSTGCTKPMTGQAVVTIGTLPTIYAVGGGGSVCPGSGVAITLSSSQSSANYQLQLNGSSTGSPKAGTGGALSWANQTSAGTYTVVSSNASCSSTMSGSAGVTINPLPTLFTVGGGGSYCESAAKGVDVTLSGSQVGVNYNLILNETIVSTGAGTGAPLTWKFLKGVGEYTVDAFNPTTYCVQTMSGSASITTNPSPASYIVSGGGSFCSGGTGVNVALNGSQTGVNYQLKLNGTNTGSSIAGTGSPLTWTNQTGAGTYTVEATHATFSCPKIMSGNATATVNPLPTLFTVDGGGSYCEGAPKGAGIFLSGSQTGVSYQLKLGGANIESPLAGTGAELAWYLQKGVGAYVVEATNSITSCHQTMTGSPTISISPLPTAPTVSGYVRFGSGALNLQGNGAPSGGSYNWYNASGALVGSGSTFTTSSLSTSITGYMSVKTSNGGCLSTSTSIDISIYDLPTISAPQGYVVKGENVTLSTGSGFASYSWTNAANEVVSTTETLNANIPGVYKVTVSKYDASGTSVPFTLNSQFSGLNMNYVVTNSILVSGVATASSVSSLPVDQASQSISYFDGLGRPTQTVATQASPLKNDLVVPTVYDGFGREDKKYLPVVTENNGRYKSNLLDVNGNYTINTYSNTTDKIADDTKPYAQTLLEASPFSRVLEVGAPGSIWQPSSSSTYTTPVATDRSIKKDYEHNVGNEVLMFNYTSPNATYPLGIIEIAPATYYKANELIKDLAKDEHNNEVIEFQDKDGHIVLKKVQADASTFAQTYYIYDDYGNLVCVLSPEATQRIINDPTSITIQQVLTNFSFLYTYDARMRMTQKQVPGALPIYMVYDELDRLVLTQDGNQRSKKKWSYTKYDELNRPIMTGIYTHTDIIDQASMSLLINGSVFYESYNGESATHGYSATSAYFPSTNLKLLTATYYDNYNFKLMVSGLDYVPNEIVGQEVVESNRVLGQVTGTKINILESTNYLYGANYYDSKYRVIQTINQNHKSGLDHDLVTNKYDFSGKVLETKRRYIVSGLTSTVKETFTYDHAGRVLSVKHSINGAADVMIVKNEYNELGQLIDKKLHSADNSATFKQSIDYRYNIRGWLTSVNNSKLNNTDFNDDINDLFGMELGYTSDLGLGATAQYNGNIAAIKWSNNTIESNVLQRGYSFSYDALNRLKAANQKQAIVFDTWTGGNYDENGLEYDLNGNIKALQRKDGNGALIDNLTYDYGTGATASNKLMYVNDAADATKGFVNGNTGTDDYNYDANGNLIIDKNKGITAITYNHLNLPIQVNKGATDYIIYTYGATGRKLSQQVFGSTAKTTDYVGELIFENNTLKFINHSEGRVLPDGANWEYQYHLKDHLGNVRATFSAKEITDAKAATLETANATTEQSQFLRFAEARKIQSFLFDHTNGSSPTTASGYAQRLNGTANEKFGLGKSISVMPGDVITAEVYAKYIDPTSSNWTTALTTLLSQIAAGTAPASTVVDGVNYSGSTNSFQFPTAAAQNTANSSEVGPKAYLNWLVFKKDGTFVLSQSGYDRLSTAPKESGQDIAHERLYSPNITITEPGFVYIYLSNEESSPLEVYFDDFKVTHTIKAPVIQTDDYYPFGLTFNSYSRENSIPNKTKFQGQEHIDDLGLGWDSFKWRNHQPDIGRFFNVDPLADKYVYNSPYAFSENHVVSHRELEGLEKVSVNDEISENTTTLKRAGATILVQSVNEEGGIECSTTINLPDGSKQGLVSDHSAKTIGEVAMRVEDSNIRITSLRRTAGDQARAMYTNLTGHGKGQGVVAQRALYDKKPGLQVVNTGIRSLAMQKLAAQFGGAVTDGQVKNTMESKINDLGVYNVTNHASPDPNLQVIDVGPKSVENDAAFGKAAKNHPDVTKFIPYPKDPGHHFEIKQPE